MVTSQGGKPVALEVIGLPMTAGQLMGYVQSGRLRFVLDQIDRAVEIARERGCTQLGFGGFTSIVTDNCLSLAEDEIALTSGNSLTAAAAIEATHCAAWRAGVDITNARLGVVGGLGNIGRVLAEIEAEEVASIVLVGRPGAQRRLERLAESLYAGAWSRAQRGEIEQGLARRVHQMFGAAGGALPTSAEQLGAALRRAGEQMGDAAPIRVSTDMHALARCDLVIAATNSPEPIILPEHLGYGRKVICDVSVPADVHPAVLGECPEVQVIKGGIVRLPHGAAVSINGMALDAGQAYACLSESLLLGMAGVREHFSYGALRSEREVRALAAEHGFEVVIKEALAAPPVARKAA
jgi:predicted amino acid dehydrogenase